MSNVLDVTPNLIPGTGISLFLQIVRDFGKLGKRSLQIFNDFGSDDVRIGEIRAVFE